MQRNSKPPTCPLVNKARLQDPEKSKVTNNNKVSDVKPSAKQGTKVMTSQYMAVLLKHREIRLERRRAELSGSSSTTSSGSQIQQTQKNFIEKGAKPKMNSIPKAVPVTSSTREAAKPKPLEKVEKIVGSSGSKDVRVAQKRNEIAKEKQQAAPQSRRSIPVNYTNFKANSKKLNNVKSRYNIQKDVVVSGDKITKTVTETVKSSLEMNSSKELISTSKKVQESTEYKFPTDRRTLECSISPIKRLDEEEESSEYRFGIGQKPYRLTTIKRFENILRPLDSDVPLKAPIANNTVDLILNAYAT